MLKLDFCKHQNTSKKSDTDIDTLLRYRHGWPQTHLWSLTKTSYKKVWEGPSCCWKPTEILNNSWRCLSWVSWMFIDLQLWTQEHPAPSHALTNALGDVSSLQGVWDSLIFPEQHWMAARTLWACSDGRSWATWRACGCQQDPHCPPHLGTPGLALSSCTSTPLMSPWAKPAHQAGCKLTSSQGQICTPAVFLGFVPKFSEAKPLTEMPVTALN